jgi:hypothetical protein
MLSLFDWPIYPRLRGTLQGSNDAQCGPDAALLAA